MERSGFLLCVCGLVLVCGLPIGAQTLTITSGFDGSSGPFIRSEMIVATLTGAEPFRPVTILYGNAALPPFAIPGVATGQLGIDPMDLNAFGPWDGLGLFGPASPFLTDASGNFSAPLIIPTTFPIAGLPWSRVFQAVTLINPLTSPGGESFALSSTAVVVIDEPATDPFISEITPHIVPENAVTPVVLTIRGTGFLPQSTVVPTVTFTSTCDPALSAQGTVIQVIPDPMIPTETALLVEAPALVGMAQTPPATNSGPMTVTVSYATTGLYPNVGVGNEGTYTTPQTTETDPVFLVYQTTLIPVITDIDPKANPSVGGCPISITGSNFLTCGVVVFNPGPGEVVVPNPLIVSDTLIQLTPPAIPQSLTTVAVRNIDHVTVSPRQSLANSPVTDFAFFTYDPTALVVNSITLSGGTDAGSLVEGSGGVFMTISGTCQEVGGYTLLDADSGPSGLRLGSNILGLDADLLVTAAADMKITSPGNWTIVAAVPALPPGIAFIPPAPSSGGLTNTGQKQVQIVPPVCVVAGGTPLPHKAYAAIPGVEPGNVLNYFAASPPMIDHILPNNCGRLDGGQTITIKGSGFLTQDVTLPSSDLLVVPGVVFSGEFAPSIPAVSVTILDEFTLEVVTPDLSALVLTPPISTDIVITNPDGQQSDVLGDQDDFHFYPSLAGLVANNFSLAGPTVLVSTTTGPGGTAIVYTFLGDLTLPAGLLVNATGEHPFIIRVRGNVVIDGDIDLSGGTVTSGAFLVPAGGGAGGAAADLLNLAGESLTVGSVGAAPTDPLTAAPYPGAGQGGFHALEAGGGGGAGMVTAGTSGIRPFGIGGPGGLAYGLPLLPLAVLGSGTAAETSLPPGGSGGGAGGLGTPSPLALPLAADDVGQNGAGGQGGGGLFIGADGTITVNGSLLARGQAGTDGAASINLPTQGGGGGGGGSGGGIVLQSLQGIFINSSATVSVTGAAGGLAGVGMGDGGLGSDGMLRFTIPTLSTVPGNILIINPGATIDPGADTTSFLQ